MFFTQIISFPIFSWPGQKNCISINDCKTVGTYIQKNFPEVYFFGRHIDRKFSEFFFPQFSVVYQPFATNINKDCSRIAQDCSRGGNNLMQFFSHGTFKEVRHFFGGEERRKERAIRLNGKIQVMPTQRFAYYIYAKRVCHNSLHLLLLYTVVPKINSKKPAFLIFFKGSYSIIYLWNFFFFLARNIGI